MSLSKKSDITDKVASIVLAGGQGTRLFPLTQSRCKPAVAFGGRYRLIDIPISNSLNSKIKRIYIISQYFASDLHQHVLGTFPPELFQRGAIQLLCPEETPNRKVWFKGTADAVRQNMEHFLKSSDEHFLILSGDQLYTVNFAPMLTVAKESGANLVIASLPVEEAEARRMGLLKIDSTGRILDFYEKPNTPELLKKFELPEEFYKQRGIPRGEKPLYLGSMGIYVFDRSSLETLLKEEGDDFGRHLIPLEIKKKRSVAYVFDGYWEDIGTIASYYQANLALISQQKCLNTTDENFPIYTTPHLLPSPLIRDTHIKNSLIAQGAIIEAKEISNSIIGIRSHVKKGTVIRDSILVGHKFYTPPLHLSPPLPQEFSIGEDCVIEKAIIDEHSCIGNRVQLINKDKIQKMDGDGIYIRDGIIIVTSGTRLPDDFIL